MSFQTKNKCLPRFDLRKQFRGNFSSYPAYFRWPNWLPYLTSACQILIIINIDLQHKIKEPLKKDPIKNGGERKHRFIHTSIWRRLFYRNQILPIKNMNWNSEAWDALPLPLNLFPRSEFCNKTSGHIAHAIERESQPRRCFSQTMQRRLCWHLPNRRPDRLTL